MIWVRPRLVTSNWDASWRNKGEPHAVSNILHHNRLTTTSSWGGGSQARAAAHTTQGRGERAQHHTTHGGGGERAQQQHTRHSSPRQPLTPTSGGTPIFLPLLIPSTD